MHYPIGEAGVRRRSGRLLLVIAFSTLMVGVLAGPSEAQVTPMRSDGLNVGRFILYPSISIKYTQDDNLRAASDDLEVVSSGILDLRARIKTELPLGQQEITWTYSPLYHDYSTASFTQPSRISHFFDFAGSFHLGPSLTATLRDYFVSSSSEVAEFDAGGEIAFSQVPFRLHEPELELTLHLGARHGLSLIPRYSALSFDEPQELGLFSYATRGIEARYLYAFSPPTNLFAYFEMEDTDQERERGVVQEATLGSRTLGVGLRRSVNDILVASATVGRESLQVAGGFGSDFSGLVMGANATWRLTDLSQLSLDLRRATQQSFFLNNNYYINNDVRIRIRHQIGRSTYWEFGAAYRENAYPEPIDSSVEGGASYHVSEGVRRRDRTFGLEAGIGYQIRSSMRLFIGYNARGRDSNVQQELDGLVIDPFDFNQNRMLFRVEAGWL